MDNFSEIQRKAIQTYITDLVVFKDLDNICLNVTDIINDQIGIPTGIYKYFLIPIHSKEYFNKIRAGFHTNNVSEETGKRTIANLMYTEILRYRANKHLFDYFNIYVYNEEDEVIQKFSNVDNITVNVINYIVDNGLLDTVKYMDFMKPKIFDSSFENIEAMQYKGYNFNEIREWTKDATEIIMENFQNNRGLSFLRNVGHSNKPVYILINSYIVKITDTKFIVLSENIFNSLFSINEPISTATLSYFYISDVSYDYIQSGDDILIIPNRSKDNAIQGSTFELTAYTGDTRIAIAYPATIRDIHSIVRQDYYDGDVKGAFVKSIVPVEINPGETPVDYKVYTYIPGQPFISDMKFTVTL